MPNGNAAPENGKIVHKAAGWRRRSLAGLLLMA
jgi:hypothetical protein